MGYQEALPLNLDTQQGPLRPLLRWAGSKQRLLPTLSALSPRDFNRYVEPFAGSAALFFYLQPSRAKLSDINSDLVNFYHTLRTSPLLLHALASDIPVTQRAYTAARLQFRTEHQPLERAALFWYLNRSCFNGLFRTNRQGHFNVPFGRKLPSFPHWQHAKLCAEALTGAQLEAHDCRAVIEDTGAGDFIYIDPPYARDSSRDRGEYGVGALQDRELAEVLNCARSASTRGAKILISYNRDLSQYLPGWKQQARRHLHLMSADANVRRAIDEYFFWNYEHV